MKLQTVRELRRGQPQRRRGKPQRDDPEAVPPDLPVGTGHAREACLLVDAARRGLRLSCPGHARDATASVNRPAMQAYLAAAGMAFGLVALWAALVPLLA